MTVHKNNTTGAATTDSTLYEHGNMNIAMCKYVTDEVKGTFTAKDGKFTLTITQIFFDGKWYTKTEALRAYSDRDKEINGAFNIKSGAYSLSDNKLTLTWESGYTEFFAKQDFTY